MFGFINKIFKFRCDCDNEVIKYRYPGYIIVFPDAVSADRAMVHFGYEFSNRQSPLEMNRAERYIEHIPTGQRVYYWPMDENPNLIQYKFIRVVFSKSYDKANQYHDDWIEFRKSAQAFSTAMGTFVKYGAQN